MGSSRVMKDGVIYYPKEIYAELGIKSFDLPPMVVAPYSVACAVRSTWKEASDP